MHVDITFDFLAVLAEYDRVTADQAFLARHWPATRKAYRYCLSTLDGSDGLPRVPADKMSGNEQDRLSDELTRRRKRGQGGCAAPCLFPGAR